LSKKVKKIELKFTHEIILFKIFFCLRHEKSKYKIAVTFSSVLNANRLCALYVMKVF